MNILITGSTGLLGQALVERLARGAGVIGLSRHPATAPATGEVSHLVCDLTDAQATRRAVRAIAPDVVIHAQAMSDVDRCEQDPKRAEQANVQTVEHLCEASKSRAIPIFILSTDYVFDGAKGRPYDEADEPHPLSVYGKTKLAGERVALRYPGAFVIRSSTFFGPGRRNFCDAIVQRAKQREPVDVFSDQATSPTYTVDLAEGLQALLDAMARDPQRAWPRVYHMANGGGCRRVEFARRVLELLGYPASLVRPIRMAQQPHPAPRPSYSVLTSRHPELLIGRPLRPWGDALHAYLLGRHEPLL